MALVTQQKMKIDGEERPVGWVIPKEIENDPSNSFVSSLKNGRVIALPDQLVFGQGNMELSESEVNKAHVDLDKTIPEVKKAVKDVHSKDRLDELHSEEAKGQDRKGVYIALEERRNELQD